MTVRADGIAAVAARLASGATTAVGECERRLALIDRRDGELRAFIEVDAEGALAAAAASDARRGAEEAVGPLDGVPVAIKANVAVHGLAWSAGMDARRDEVATHDAPVTAALRAAGAVILGTLNMAEGALGGTTDNPWFGSCRNPRDPARTSGGSSGGAGAAVAAGFCALAIGTDTLGSVRLPAAYCGVVGLKPTFGLVSHRGVVPLSRFLDHVGVVGPGVADVAAAMPVVAVPDEGYPWSRRAPRALSWQTGPGRLDGCRIGVPTSLLAICDDGVRRAFEAALAVLADLGADVVERPLDLDAAGVRRAAFGEVEAGAYAFHRERMEAAPERFGGDFVAYAGYGRELPAWRLTSFRERVHVAQRAMEAALDAVEILALPTAPHVAFRAGERPPDNQADLTAPASVAGLPAVSVPCGAGEGSMPAGLQFVGRAYRDDDVLRVAAAYEAQARRRDNGEVSGP